MVGVDLLVLDFMLRVVEHLHVRHEFALVRSGQVPVRPVDTGLGVRPICESAMAPDSFVLAVLFGNFNASLFNVFVSNQLFILLAVVLLEVLLQTGGVEVDFGTPWKNAFVAVSISLHDMNLDVLLEVGSSCKLLATVLALKWFFT